MQPLSPLTIRVLSWPPKDALALVDQFPPAAEKGKFHREFVALDFPVMMGI